MTAENLNAMLIAGLLAILGALVYAVGDVLLLSGKVTLEAHPRLQPHAKALSGTERMAELSWRRIAWGGLLGVFVTPLMLAGFWQLYAGMQPAGMGLSLPPAVLFTWSSVVGAFVHGSFIYLGEYVQAIDRLNEAGQTVLLGMYARHRRIMVVTYAFVFACVIAASIWFSILVGLGRTYFPRWIAAVNPVTMVLVWMVVKKLLPAKITAYTEGAGFNIAYLLFFIFTTAALWRVGQI